MNKPTCRDREFVWVHFDKENRRANGCKTDTDTGNGTGNEEHGVVTLAGDPKGASEENKSARDLSTTDTTETLADRVTEDGAENGEELDHGVTLDSLLLLAGMPNSFSKVFWEIIPPMRPSSIPREAPRRPIPITAKARRQLSADLGVSDKWTNLEGMYITANERRLERDE